MSNIRLIGLESIKIGPSVASLATIEHIVPDSAHIVLNAPSIADLFCEETEYPDVQLITAGKKTIEFATRDMGVNIMENAFGGTASLTTTWTAPVTALVISERSFQIISKKINGKQLKFVIKRASLYAGGELKFAKTESGQITFSADVLMPVTGAPIVMTVM